MVHADGCLLAALHTIYVERVCSALLHMLMSIVLVLMGVTMLCQP